jgi:hypothetical protein
MRPFASANITRSVPDDVQPLASEPVDDALEEEGVVVDDEARQMRSLRIDETLVPAHPR